jgi:hypothetical protein
MPLANASSATLPPPSHGPGSGWIATPFLHDSFIHYFTPVYPDAIQAEGLPHKALPRFLDQFHNLLPQHLVQLAAGIQLHVFGGNRIADPYGHRMGLHVDRPHG